MTRQSVQGGYCEDIYGSHKCALERKDCLDRSTFRSARQTQEAPLNAHGGRCRWQSAVTSFKLGRCMDSNGDLECAPNSDSCPAYKTDTEDIIMQTYMFPDEECGVEETRYGRCDYDMCAWGSDDCALRNTWEPLSEGCTCDQVQVGGCSRDKDGQKEVFCAVSSLACDEEQTWIVPQEVEIAAGFVCYLCFELSSTTPTQAPESNSTPAPESNLIMDGSPFVELESGKQPTIGTATLAIVVCAGAVLALSILGLVGYKVLSKRRDVETRRRALVEEQSGLPTRTIHIAEGHNENNHLVDSEK